jgi:hypothetical protein
VVLKLYWGDPREKVCEAVAELSLESLVMGSRGLGQIQRFVITSELNCFLKFIHSESEVSFIRNHSLLVST